MINKDLIEIQKGVVSTCVVILKEDCNELDSNVSINSNYDYGKLSKTFKDISTKENLNYFVINDIDKLDESSQNIYCDIVKDRELCGYKLPKDTIVVLTINDKEGLKNISKELYHFCVVAF